MFGLSYIPQFLIFPMSDFCMIDCLNGSKAENCVDVAHSQLLMMWLVRMPKVIEIIEL